MYGFNIAVAQIPVGVGYAVWSAIGTVVVSLFGVLHFQESMTLSKAACLLVIVVGVVGLNLTD